MRCTPCNASGRLVRGCVPQARLPSTQQPSRQHLLQTANAIALSYSSGATAGGGRRRRCLPLPPPP